MNSVEATSWQRLDVRCNLLLRRPSASMRMSPLGNKGQL
jgi:hypothetical protein